MAAAGQTFLYGNASQQFGTGAWDWPSLLVGALLVSAAYVPQINVDTYVSDIPSSAIIALSDQNDGAGDLTNMAMVNGIAQGLLPAFLSLISTTPVAAVVLFVDTGADSTSSLIYYSNNGAGFPFLPEGFNYAVVAAGILGGWFQV